MILLDAFAFHVRMREKALPPTLPDAPDELKEIITGQTEKIVDLEHEIDRLQHILRLLQRRHFGVKSERIPDGQQLFGFYGAVELAEKPPKDEPKIPRKKKGKKGRKIIPANLPRVEIIIDVSKDQKCCCGCGQSLLKIGEEINEILEYKEAELFVLRRVRPKYACPKDACKKKTGIVTAEPPADVIPKSKAGPGLLARVLTAKYALHLPAYRQEYMFSMMGLSIPRQTICGWVGRCVELLEPIYEAMKKDILASVVIFSDDTPVRLFEPEKTPKKTHLARVWAYVGDIFHRQIVYEFTRTREHQWPQQFMKGFTGTLQSDAYAGYNALYAAGATGALCWAHARRKFFEAEDSDKERSKIAMARIRELYQVEEQVNGQHPKRKKRRRRGRTKRRLNSFKKWLDREINQVLPKSPMAMAIQYARGHWKELTHFVSDGMVEIDSNRVERSIRGVKLGSKNWLFFGSEDGGRWGAVMYSLMESCKLHGINPQAYLKDVLVRISSTPVSQIDSLMPSKWKPSVPRNPDSS